jgi:hypothetical protein
MEKRPVSPITLVLFFSIAALAIIGAVLTQSVGVPIVVFESIVKNLLTIATDVLYLIGGGLVFFAVILVLIRFVKAKLSDPFQPAGVTRILSGYLTLSLEVFIGAEIVRTVVISASDIYLLILVILSRGLFSLILYLERRWHGTAESE